MRVWVPAALVLLAWAWPQQAAEAWAWKAGGMIALAAGAGAWALLRPGRMPARAFGAWALLTGWSVVAALAGVDPVRGLGQAVAVAGAAALVLLAGGRMPVAGVVVAWIGVAGLEAAVVLRQAQGAEGGLRFSGTFVNANHMAALVTGGAAALAAVALRARPPWQVFAAAAIVPLSLAGAWSGSRGAPLAAAVGAAALAWGGRRERHGARLWIVLACLTVPYFAAGMAWPRLSGAGVADEPMAFSRVALWRAATRVAAEAPLGAGPGAFGDALGIMLVGEPPRPFTSEYAHCEPLQWWCEAGTIGAALLVWALTCWWRARAHGGREAGMRLALGAAVAAFGVFVLVDFPLRSPPLAWLAVLAMAALTAPPAAGGPRWTRRPATRWVPAALLGLGAVFALAAGVADGEFAAGAREAAGGNRPAAASRFARALAVLPWHAGALQGLAAVEPGAPESAERLARARRLRPLWLSPPVRRPPDWRRGTP